MKNRTRLSVKLLIIGLVAAAGLSVLFLVTFVTGKAVDTSTHLNNLRQDQIVLVNDMEKHILRLSWAAMDAIVDRESGTVDKELRKEMDESISFLSDKHSEIEKAADHESEKKLAEDLEKHLPAFTSLVGVDLIRMIEESGKESVRIREEFAALDDSIDSSSDIVLGSIEKLYPVLETKDGIVKPGTDPARLKDTLRSLEKQVLGLSLTAMDAIVDRDAGKVSEQRMNLIRDHSGELRRCIAVLRNGLLPAAEMTYLSGLETGAESMITSISKDLPDHIKASGARDTEIRKKFADMDNSIDEQSGILMGKMGDFSRSVKKELSESQNELNAKVAGSTVVSFLTFIITLSVLASVIFILGRGIVRSLGSVAEVLSTGAEQVATAAQQISSGSQNIAEGTSEQASSLEEISSSLQEMASMTTQNAGNAKKARELSDETAESAIRGDEAMDRMSGTIELIQQSSNDTARIIKTIDEIAFQTNLLALNAAVEAARAGEAGKGFAVVAEEVRSLAQRSAEAAKNTAALIEESRKNTENGVNAAGETSIILKEIVERVQKVSNLVAEVAAASDEQAEGITQVNTAVSEMSQVTQENAANAEESSSGSEELSAQAQELHGMVDILNGIILGKAGSRTGETTHYRIDRELTGPERRATAVTEIHSEKHGKAERVSGYSPAKKYFRNGGNGNENGNGNGGNGNGRKGTVPYDRIIPLEEKDRETLSEF